MGRKDTRTLRNIRMICRMQNIDEEALYNRSKLILSIYRDICWSVMGRADRIHDEIVCTFGSNLDRALIYLETFAPDEARERFEEKIRSLFESRWMVELVDSAMLQIREYPCRGDLYFEILSKSYLSRFQYREAEMLECMDLERSTYYDRKKEAWTIIVGKCDSHDETDAENRTRNRGYILSPTKKRYNPDSFTTESPTSLMIK